MMRRIDLLPVAYVQQRRERRNISFVLVAGGLVLLLLVGWYFLLRSQVSNAREELAQIEQENAQLQVQIDELQRFADLELEVQTKRTALTTVFAGDLNWPALLTEVAMVVPGEVWLDSLTTSAGTTEGAAPVATEANPIRVSQELPTGRIAFDGQSVCMPGVAKWLIRLTTVKEFNAVWLGNATENDTKPGCELVTFQSTLELSDEAYSHRFEGDLE